MSYDAGRPTHPYPGGAPVWYPADHPSGTTILVLGILSLMVCPVTGIFAITMGNKALCEIDASPGAYANRQTVVVGRVLGIVSLAVYGVALVLYVDMVAGFFAFALHYR